MYVTEYNKYVQKPKKKKTKQQMTMNTPVNMLNKINIVQNML